MKISELFEGQTMSHNFNCRYENQQQQVQDKNETHKVKSIMSNRHAEKDDLQIYLEHGIA